MNIKELNLTLQKFWNDAFNIDASNLGTIDPSTKDKFDEYCQFIGDNCENVLDIGTGFGNGLISAKYFGTKMKSGLGIDTSVNGIEVAKKFAEKNNITGLEFKVGDNELLNIFANESYDGVICSNVLDVLPEVTSNQIIKNIKRLVKPNGYVFLKLNFYLDKVLINRLKMEKINRNTYAMNGVIRALNHTTQAWINKFSGFKVVKVDEFERIPNGPKDRIILLQKLDK